MVSKDQDLMRELMEAFHAEAPDHIQTLNQTLLQLERRIEGEQHAGLLQEAFRAAHSLKGAARAVGFTPIEKLAHSIEDVLKQARDSGLSLDPSTCDVLYHAFDIIQKLLDGEQTEIEPLLEQMTLLSTTAAPEQLPTTGSETPIQPVMVEGEETIRVAVSKLDQLMAQASELLMARISAEQRLVEMQTLRQQWGNLPLAWRDIKAASARVHQTDDDNEQFRDSLGHFEDYLHDLTRAMNRLDTEMNRDALRLEMVSGRLQSEMRRVRMVPFQTLEPVFQRTVRDAARLEDKQVELVFEGGEVEVDKKVLEALKDAFLHVLTNAVSHGIETPEVREANRKPPFGTIHIRLLQRGSEAHITVRDDGRGFDMESLRKSAQARDVVVNESPSETDIINLAFLPGVTTSQHLTTLAGRGVGLDVVRRQIENLQGRIAVESLAGYGTAFQFIVPVSLAMTRVLLVSVGGHRYGLPLASVERIVRTRTTFSVEGQTMLALENDSMPVIPLAGLLNLPVEPAPGALSVIVGSAEQRIALLVDDVLSEQELAVKPFSKPVVRVRHLAGAATMGSGDPVIVLNTSDLAKSARGVRVQPILAPDMDQTNEAESATHILIVDDSITTRTLEKNILEAAGYEVHTATDGVRALHQLKTYPIDLIVADVEMPNMDGITLSRHLRDSKEYPELPIILVTSLESAEDRELGMLAGANAYIVKRGFNQAELLATIQQFI